MSIHPRVDPREFRAFCFRGAGRANFVISAEKRSDGSRIVWRLAKKRKKGTITPKPTSILVNRYMENVIAPFFNSDYLVDPRLVEFKVEDLFQIAKIPSLESNHFIECFEDLALISDKQSFLHLNDVPLDVRYIPALEMLDATQISYIPRKLKGASTITVEIKPKQGFFQKHENVDVPFCNNCILQIEKCSSSLYDDMYDFCPLDLFSGNKERTSHALRELFRNPHRNLRIFLNGNLVHANEALVDYHDLDGILFEGGCGSTEDLLIALSYVLTGSSTESDCENFRIHPKSVLGQILTAQRQDPIGIVEAYRIYQSLPKDVQRELGDKTRLPVNSLSILSKDDDRSKIEKYFLSATMKDCSIMVSFQAVADKPDHCSSILVPSGTMFAYSIKVVDLDPKSPKNLLNGFNRFNAGVKLIRLGSDQIPIPPCVYGDPF